MADDLEAFPARVAPQAQRPPEVGTVARCRRWLRAGFDGGTAEEPGSQILARLVIFVILAGSLLAMLETEASLWHDAAVASAFQLLDRALLVFFVLEYGLRLWAAGEAATLRGWPGGLLWGGGTWALWGHMW